MRRVILLLVCLCGAIVPTASAAPVQFTLTDQNARVHVVKYPRDKVSVLVLSDQQGSSQIESWISPLHARYGERIDIAGIADLPGIPPMFQGLFRREFKKRLTYPVMLDWSGDVARSFGYQKKQAQLFVIGTDGKIALSKVGAATSPALTEVYRTIDQLQRRR
jgi:hypothetical protein